MTVNKELLRDREESPALTELNKFLNTLLKMSLEKVEKQTLEEFTARIQSMFDQLTGEEQKKARDNYFLVLGKIENSPKTTKVAQTIVQGEVAKLLEANEFLEISDFLDFRNILELDDKNWSSLRVSHFYEALTRFPIENQKTLWNMIFFKSRFRAYKIEERDMKILLSFLESVRDTNYKREFTKKLETLPSIAELPEVRRWDFLSGFYKFALPKVSGTQSSLAGMPSRGPVAMPIK